MALLVRLSTWSVDHARGELVRHHSEEWFDSYDREGSRDRWKFVFVGADGRCKWKERRAKLEAAERILGTLKAGHVDGEGLRGSTLLPGRRIAEDVARPSLVAPEGKAVIEGAVYASEDDRADWRVFQILDDILCERDGVTLVHDRRPGNWYSIHDVKPTGCDLNWPSYDFYGMQVIDGELHTSTCCLGQRSPDTFAIDLSSWRVRVVPDTVAVDMEENPIISDIKRTAFEE